jgi:crossover junction endodeoxyribonuclease RuvC
MITLALDLGTRTGWAIGEANLYASGTWDLAPSRQRRFEGGGMKWVRLREYLNSLGPIDRVVVEEVRRHAGVDAAHCYGGALATVSSWCEEKKIPYSAEPVGTIKKFATGKGNAGKPEMIEAARTKFSVVCSDDNEADAVALFYLTVRSAA